MRHCGIKIGRGGQSPALFVLRQERAAHERNPSGTRGKKG
jgi:hypothetical protein